VEKTVTRGKNRNALFKKYFKSILVATLQALVL